MMIVKRANSKSLNNVPIDLKSSILFLLNDFGNNSIYIFCLIRRVETLHHPIKAEHYKKIPALER